MVVALAEADSGPVLLRLLLGPPDLEESGESPSADPGALLANDGSIVVEARDCLRCLFGATCTGREWLKP
jgi:hypothetical protein